MSEICGKYIIASIDKIKVKMKGIIETKILSIGTFEIWVAM